MSSWSLKNCGDAKPLQFGSFDELVENTKTQTPPSQKIVTTLTELEKRANLNRIEGDQELAYVYLMRYLSIALDLRKKRIPCEAIDNDNLMKMFDLADELKKILIDRYENRRINGGKEIPPSLQNSEKISKNGEEASKPTENQENKRPNLPDSSKPSNKLWIEAKGLYDLMKQGRNVENLLIFDVRPAEDFIQAHIDFPGVVHIDPEWLTPGTADSKIERELAVSKLGGGALFAKRFQTKNIVLVDWDSPEKGGLLPDLKSPLHLLFLALTQWRDKPLQNCELQLLKKGYNNFLLKYPYQTTKRGQNEASQNPANQRIQNQVEAEFRRPLQQVTDYPDFDEFFSINQKQKPGVHGAAIPQRPPKPGHLSTTQASSQQQIPTIASQLSNGPRDKSSPLSQMTIPRVDRSNKPSLTQANKMLAPATYPQPSAGKSKAISATENRSSTSSTASSTGETVVVTKKSSVETLPQSQVDAMLDTKTRDDLKAEIDVLEERKKQQLNELAAIMRENRKIRSEQQPKDTPFVPSSGDQVDAALLVDIEPAPKPPVEPEKPKVPEFKPARVRARSVSPKGDKVPAPMPQVDRARKPVIPKISNLVDSSSNNNVPTPKIAANDIPQPRPQTQPQVPPRQSVSSNTALMLPFPDNSADWTVLAPTYGPTHGRASGLRNLGNTCFMASIVQCLAAAPAFSDYYLFSAYKTQILQRQKLLLSQPNFNAERYRAPLATVEMARLVKAMLSSQIKALAPRPLKEVIGAKNSAFATFKQQDAQEFLAELLDTLHEEMNCGEKTILALANQSSSSEDPDPQDVRQAWDLHRRHHSSVIVELFHGMLRSTVTCSNCQKVHPKYDAFVYLTLPVPRNGGRITIHDCLASYVYPELIDGWRCSNCKKPSRVSKKLDIVRPPAILIVHLNRFAWSGEWRAKITEPVLFEIDNFRLNDRSYSLFAICNHYGTLEAGHYTATTRPPSHLERRTPSFFRYDDAEVSSVSAHSLAADERNASAAYLLFYAANDVDWARYRHDLMRQAKL